MDPVPTWQAGSRRPGSRSSRDCTAQVLFHASGQSCGHRFHLGFLGYPSGQSCGHRFHIPHSCPLLLLANTRTQHIATPSRVSAAGVCGVAAIQGVFFFGVSGLLFIYIHYIISVSYNNNNNKRPLTPKSMPPAGSVSYGYGFG